MGGRGRWKRRKRRAAIRRLRNRLLLPVARVGLSLLSRLPLEGASRAGEAAGRLAFAMLGGVRRRTLRHLEMALGDRRPAPELEAAARGSFQLFAACAFEWIVLCRWGPERACGAMTGFPGRRHLEEALARGRGVIVVTAHFGLFELMPVFVIREVASGKVVGRRPSDRGFEEIVVERRLRMGVPTIPQQQPREILRVLRRGRIVGILPDQDVDKLPGIFVPFFGRPAYTPTGPATVSVATGAPLVPAFMLRVGPGRHRLYVYPEIPDPGGTKEERVRALTLGWTRVFEEVIAARPDHWAWMHERWATTPESLAERRARQLRKRLRKAQKPKHRGQA